MRSYMKKKEKRVSVADSLTVDEIVANTLGRNRKFSKRVLLGACLLCVMASAAYVVTSFGRLSDNILPEDGSMVALASTPIAAASTKKDLISIPTGTVNQNPFMPYRNIGDDTVIEVPKFDLVEPPEMVNEASDAARVMDTIVSGILYDRYSPSAILNIEGSDYLVKKGDTVNNYKVMDIVQDSVTVKLGNNVYKAGIGEILTEGTVNHNEVSNLSKKFGGEKR